MSIELHYYMGDMEDLSEWIAESQLQLCNTMRELRRVVEAGEQDELQILVKRLEAARTPIYSFPGKIYVELAYDIAVKLSKTNDRELAKNLVRVVEEFESTWAPCTRD